MCPATPSKRGWRGFTFAEVLLCVALFVACTIHIRLRLKAARAALAASQPSGEAT